MTTAGSNRSESLDERRLVRIMRKAIAVFPVPANLVDRLFHEKKKVFVKYLTHTTSPKLERGSKVIFYASHGQKKIVGEGVVESVEFLTADEALEKYGEKLFLSKVELLAYRGIQPSRDPLKQMLVLVLAGLRKYRCGISYPRPITMAGEYLTLETYKSLMKA